MKKRKEARAVLRLAAALALVGHCAAVSAQALDDATLQVLGSRFDAIQPRMVEWRRDIHQHPELSGQEVRTAALVAEHLRKLGMDVRTGVGGHGVVGVHDQGLRIRRAGQGARPGYECPARCVDGRHRHDLSAGVVDQFR